MLTSRVRVRILRQQQADPGRTARTVRRDYRPIGSTRWISPCADGDVWADGDVPGFGPWCLPYDYASLYCANGSASLLSYSDHSTFDCSTPLPNPATCPSVMGFQLCGPACGDCMIGPCTGRSPLHPFGLCLPSLATCSLGKTKNCAPYQVCMSFKVAPEDQHRADMNGICVAANTCAAIAAGYPGGMVCTP